MFGFSEWPKRQVLNDLWALGQVSLARAPLLSRFERDGQGAMVERLRHLAVAKEMRLETGEDYLPLLEFLNDLARDGDTAEAGFALAVLLADAVHGQVGPEEVDFNWQDWRCRLEDMPRAWAVTLARGYEAAIGMHRPEDFPRPDLARHPPCHGKRTAGLLGPVFRLETGED